MRCHPCENRDLKESNVKKRIKLYQSLARREIPAGVYPILDRGQERHPVE
jgi:hypothetical protein